MLMITATMTARRARLKAATMLFVLACEALVAIILITGTAMVFILPVYTPRTSTTGLLVLLSVRELFNLRQRNAVDVTAKVLEVCVDNLRSLETHLLSRCNARQCSVIMSPIGKFSFDNSHDMCEIVTDVCSPLCNGACGRTCSAKSSCKEGSCVCPKDQCGDKCLNLLTHPSNCGRCGNKCSSGYCFQGQCYDPPKDKCSTYGVTNGDFSQGGANWELNERYSQEGSSVTMDGSELRVWVEDTQYTRYTQWIGRAKMCPNTSYDVSYRVRRVAGNKQPCSVFFVIGDQQQNGQGMEQIPNTVGEGLREKGPFTVPGIDPANISQNSKDLGWVKQDGLGYDVQFNVNLYCDDNQGGAEFRFDDFQIVASG